MPILKKLSLEFVIAAVNKKRSFSGFDKHGALAEVIVPYDDLNHFGVAVQKHPYRDGVGGLERNEIEIALQSLYFETIESVWYEERYIKRDNDKAGYLYLIRLHDTDLCKIGISKDYPKRIKAFSVEFPIETEVLAVFKVSGMQSLEDLMHGQFIDRHKHGEWFSLIEKDIERFMDMMRDFGEQVE